MENLILAVVLLMIIGISTFYTYKKKKQGVKCIGCPYGKTCGSKGSCKTHVEN